MSDIESFRNSFRKIEELFIEQPKKKGALPYVFCSRLGEDRLLIAFDAGKAAMAYGVDVEKATRKIGEVFGDLPDAKVFYVDTDRGTSLYIALPRVEDMTPVLEALSAAAEKKFIANKRRHAANEERHAATEILKTVEKAEKHLEKIFGAEAGRDKFCGALRHTLKKVGYPCRQLEYP